MRCWILLFVLLTGCHHIVPRPTAGTHSTHLTWVASTTPGVTYVIYRKAEACTGSGSFTQISSAPVTGLSYDDANLPNGVYCYQVTSYLTGNTPPESAPSNKAEASIIPPSPPQNLQVTPTAVTLGLGGQQQFQAMRGSTAVPASWLISPQEGTIDASGLYRAPSSMKGNNVKVQVLARESNESATADITLRK